VAAAFLVPVCCPVPPSLCAAAVCFVIRSSPYLCPLFFCVPAVKELLNTPGAASTFCSLTRRHGLDSVQEQVHSSYQPTAIQLTYQQQ
jgi:hypothetical protein